MGDDITINRKALRDYHVLETYEAGIELKGTEVKSVRQGYLNLQDAYASIKDALADNLPEKTFPNTPTALYLTQDDAGVLSSVTMFVLAPVSTGNTKRSGSRESRTAR